MSRTINYYIFIRTRRQSTQCTFKNTYNVSVYIYYNYTQLHIALEYTSIQKINT